MSNLVVSNVTSDRFSLSWRTREKAFDTFVVEVRESALPSQAMGRTLPGDVRATVMAGLKANTSYDIKLYASKGGTQNTQPLLAVATTGIPVTLHCIGRYMCSGQSNSKHILLLFRGRPAVGADSCFVC